MLVVGCSPKSDTAPHNDNKKKEETNGGKKDVIPEEDEEPIEVVLEAPEIPSNIASVISYPVGEFSGKFHDEQQEDIEAKLEQLPSISRSEERRVGKERRAQWTPTHERK